MKRFLRDNGLSVVLFTLFFACLAGQALAGWQHHNQEQTEHGQFWFESFQNWQSEFMSVGAIVVLSIFLREKGSPESKPVYAPHAETGA